MCWELFGPRLGLGSRLGLGGWRWGWDLDLLRRVLLLGGRRYRLLVRGWGGCLLLLLLLPWGSFGFGGWRLDRGCLGAWLDSRLEKSNSLGLEWSCCCCVVMRFRGGCWLRLCGGWGCLVLLGFLLFLLLLLLLLLLYRLFFHFCHLDLPYHIYIFDIIFLGVRFSVCV